MFKLHFPYSINPTFSVGDIVYYKIDKRSGRFIYQQIPNFDGGVLILERDTNKILALNGGFNYFTSNLNMVTEKKINLKKALFPFFNFLVLDQKCTPGMVSYLIRPKGARALLEGALPFQDTVDQRVGRQFIQTGKLKIYSLYPEIIKHIPFEDSIIQDMGGRF